MPKHRAADQGVKLAHFMYNSILHLKKHHFLRKQKIVSYVTEYENPTTLIHQNKQQFCTF